MAGSRGMSLALPSNWNRSRATALGVTLLLHVLMAAWLLALRFETPAVTARDTVILWLPIPVAPPLFPRPLQETSRPQPEPATSVAEPLPEQAPATFAPPPVRDWHRAAQDVAGAIGGGPAYQAFGEMPRAPTGRPEVEYTPSIIFERPLPRVGTTVTTPEGETILWVSDRCYISLYSRSLTMHHIHEGRRGVRTCNLASLGKPEPRGDLFDSIKRPALPQEPGCGPDGIGLSCAR